jgi:hypothetical protein
MCILLHLNPLLSTYTGNGSRIHLEMQLVTTEPSELDKFSSASSKNIKIDSGVQVNTPRNLRNRRKGTLGNISFLGFFSK